VGTKESKKVQKGVTGGTTRKKRYRVGEKTGNLIQQLRNLRGAKFAGSKEKKMRVTLKIGCGGLSYQNLLTWKPRSGSSGGLGGKHFLILNVTR